MRKILLPLFCLWFLLGGCRTEASSTLVTATITVTNTAGTTNGQTIQVNGDTRTWTNSVFVPASQILTNNSIGGCATNLFNQVADFPFLNLSLALSGTNGITLQTAPNGGLAVTLSAGWATVTLTTNTLTSAQVLRLPITVEYPSNQVSMSTFMAQALEYGTYGISSNAPALSNYCSLSTTQTVSAAKTFASFAGTAASITNGNFLNPTLTNGVNYGNAFSSKGLGSASEQFGASASAATNSATAVGPGANALNIASTALGNSSIAQGQNSLALGYSAFAGFLQATAVGASSLGNAINATAVGYNANAAYSNSTAIGTAAATTAPNQVMLGSAGVSVSVNNALNVGGGETIANGITNLLLTGQNNAPAGADITFGRYALTTLANSNNAAIVVGTNVFVEVSGPSAAFNINGISGGRDGKLLVLLNRTGQNMTLANDSGVDPTPSNRLYCLTGADKSITGNSAALLIYSGSVTHWIVLSFTQ